jgi:hypothetical protein
MDPRLIPDERTTKPQFQIWPPQRHRAILWLVAQITLYRGQGRRDLIPIDYMDSLRRHRCKIYQHHKRRELVGNYPRIINMVT